MGKIWIIACKSLICPDWLTLLSSNFQVSKIKTSSSISIWSKQQPSNHVDGQPPLTLCVSSSSLFVHIAQRAFFLLSVSPHQSRWRGLIAIELCNFWYSDWLVEYMGGGVGGRVEICLLSISANSQNMTILLFQTQFHYRMNPYARPWLQYLKYLK